MHNYKLFSASVENGPPLSVNRENVPVTQHHVAKTSYKVAALLLVLVITVFYLLTIRQGHNWGDDFSQYIIHARNIVDGIPYKQTGHIINKVYNIAPETYPPVFPLLLAPVYYLVGVDLQAFKVIGVLAFSGFLLAAFFVFCKFIPGKYALILLAFIGLNPYCWDFKDSILSEFPFLFFIFVSFAVVLHIPERLSWWQGVRWYLLAGVAIYLAIGCRSVGIILLPAFVIHEVFRKPKSKQWYVFVALSIFTSGVLLYAQKLYLNSTGEGYLTQLQHYYRPELLKENMLAYAAEFTNFLTGTEVTTVPGILGEAIFLIFFLAALLGFLLALRKRVTIIEVFTIGYLLSVIIWPMFQGMRLLLPFMPLFLYYVMVFIYLCPLFRQQIKPFLLSLFGVLSFGFLLFYKSADYQTVKYALQTPDARELISFVSYTPEDAVFLFDKPRALTLFTKRAAGINHCTDNPDDLGLYIKEIKASYLITNQGDQSCASKFAGSKPEISQKVFENGTYVVYRFSDAFLK